jgi:hypothetical protein
LHAGVPDETAPAPDEAELELAPGAEAPGDAALALAEAAGEVADDVDPVQPAVRTPAAISGKACHAFFTRSPIVYRQCADVLMTPRHPPWLGRVSR